MPKITEETLCWRCGNACIKGCSWSKDFTPVKGWKAKYLPLRVPKHDGKKFKATGGKLPSYRVRKCPEFIPDGRTIEIKPKERRRKNVPSAI